MTGPLTRGSRRGAGRRPALRRTRRDRRDRRRGRRLVSRAVARRRPGRLRHRPLRHPAARGRRRRGRRRRRCCRARPRRSSRSPGHRTAPGWPTWSAPAAPSAPNCTSSAPTAPATGWSRARTRAPPSSPAAGPAPATTSARSPPATGRTPTSSWSTPPTGAHRTLARGGFLSVTAVSADERFVLARRGPRGLPAHRRHRRRHRRAAAGAGASTPPAASPRRTAGSGRTAARSTCAPRCPGRPVADRAGLVVVPLSDDGVPGEGARRALAAPTPISTATPLRTDGTVLAVWNAGGVTELLGARRWSTATWCGRSRCRSRSCRAGRWPPTARR